MSEPPDDHTLNACLARVIGIVTKERITESGENKFLVYYGEEGVDIWDPLESTLQMELVEAWIIEKHKRLAITMHWGGSNWHVTIRVYREKEHEGLDPDKKRAFALAIWEMTK